MIDEHDCGEDNDVVGEVLVVVDDGVILLLGVADVSPFNRLLLDDDDDDCEDDDSDEDADQQPQLPLTGVEPCELRPLMTPQRLNWSGVRGGESGRQGSNLDISFL